MKTILLIEDDKDALDFVASGLRQAGHAVTQTSSGIRGYELAMDRKFSAIIIDRLLADLDGLELVKRLRCEGKKSPVLFLSAKADVQDRVDGLEAGGDDYLAKPFAFSELLARLGAITRRSNCDGATELCVGDLNVNLLRREVRRGGKPIVLQPKEFVLLSYLLRNVGRIVTRTMLLQNVWELEFEPGTNLVETHISRLRRKIDRGHQTELIRTIRGSGYIVCAD